MSVTTLFPYYKFTKCCDDSVIYFTGSLTITSGYIYSFAGVTPFVGSGGSLEPGFCYVIESLISQTAVLYPAAPPSVQLQYVTTCTDPKCAPCEIITCECPEGYVEIDGECVETVIIEATYTGTTVQLNAAVNETSYNKFGLRLYPDITASVKPLLGSGNPYLVKANNGAGATITPLISGVQSTLWGCELPSACSTFTGPPSTYGGRLNITGLWNNAYNVPSGDGPELAFEYCIDIAETKQYLIGIAGDNKVKLYVDGILNVFLNVGGGGGTAPFNWWHVFPITLTAGTHVIRLGGINVGNTSGAFAGEIYDIDLATFQSTLTFPALGAGNCGNTIANLEPYIIFSTEDMIGLNVPNPSTPGDWECPTGYTLNECLGVPVCTIETRFLLECPCYLLIPCDGITPPFISNTSGLDIYINEFVSVSYGEFTGCVYVIEQDDPNCENGVEVIIDGDITCDCDTICYYIEGAQGISYVQYIDNQDQLLQITPAATQPWLTLCSKIYPIVGNTSDNYTITALGDCIENDCPPKCYKLIDCEDPLNILYSTSFVLLPHAINQDVIKIAGYTECWLVEITEEDCDCAIDVRILITTETCEECKEIIAYKLTSCSESFNTQYTYDDLSQYVDQTLLTDCGCFIVELINYAPPSIQTITIITSFIDCVSCERPYYRLTECNTDETIDTFTDISQYIGQVVNLANCDGCYEVELVIIPINPSIVTVTNSYNDCITCATTAPCICSNVRNDNTIAYTYDYINCYGDTVAVTVQPGETSPKVCLIKWLEPEGCDCLIRTVTIGSSVTSTVLNASGTLINFKNSWDATPGGSLYIYYNGTQWIMNNSLEQPQYYLPPSKSDCPSGTWKPFSSIPQETPTIISTVSCQSFYQYFGDCNNGVCPAPIYPKRGIKPGYNTPACSAEKYEEISCKSSQILYRQVLTLRYGISNCCPEEDEYWLVKKELIDLAALYNPDYICAPANSCGCNNNCNCSTAEPVCPPLPPLPITSYNCTDGACVLVSGSEGQYPTLAACEENCTPLPIISYNCINNTCVDPGDGSGIYATLLECEDNCNTPTTSYNCVDGNCVSVSGSSGQYPTLIACEEDCAIVPIVSYNCIDNTCVDPGDGTGEYSTLLACEENCGLSPIVSYDCFDGSCVDPGDGSGNYPTLVDCENSFIIVNQCIDQGIIDSGIVGGLGDQFDWMSINHPSSLTYSYYFETNIPCTPTPTVCVGPNDGCLLRLGAIEIVDIVNIVILFTTYQIDDLIIYLNTNYPTCTPVFFEGQSYNSIAAQLQRCNPDLSLELAGSPCVCNLECANIE